MIYDAVMDAQPGLEDLHGRACLYGGVPRYLTLPLFRLMPDPRRAMKV